MSTALVQVSVKKIAPAIIIAAAVVLVAGLWFSVQQAEAVAPADFGLTEGDTISAAGSNDPDVYIVNEHGYKRLFLNPVIFSFYGHLGGFANVKSVTPATRDAFGTSGLYRYVDEQAVYCVEVTGEDTATFHWVNTTGDQAVADDADFFKKVFTINLNEKNWYQMGSNYSSPNDCPDYSRTPGTTPTPSGPLSVSLAPNNPAAATVTTNAQGVDMLKVRFSGTGTITGMTVKRGGAGTVGDITNVYLYDGAERLTSGKSISSSTGEAKFISLGISVNGTKDITVVADLSGNAGNVHNFTLNNVVASGTVSGLSVTGNDFTVSGATGGTVTLAKTGTVSNATVGSKAVKMSDFKLSAATEAALVKRITLIQGGTMKPGDFENVKLVSGTTEWMGTVNSEGYLIFDLGSGISIAKGGNAIFKVYGDVNGKKDETVKLYFESATDILAIGDQFNFGMAVTLTAMDTSAEAHSITLQGGVLTITFNGPDASTIGTTTDDSVLLRLTYVAANDIEIKKTRFNLCKDDTNNGTYNDAYHASGWADLNDFRMVDEDTSEEVLGSQDGSAFTTDDATACPGRVGGGQKVFTDTIDIAAGQTRNFKVTADLAGDDTGTGVTLATGDAIKIELNNYADATPDVAEMKYTGTTTSVADADIVPNADISSNKFTLSSASLTLGLAGTPPDTTVVKGTKNVDVVAITFLASQASSLKVTDITLTGYVEDESGDTHNEGVDTNDSGVTVANAWTNFRLYEQETGNMIASAGNITSDQLATINVGTLAFAIPSDNETGGVGDYWTIPAGETRTLLVRADASTNDASGSNGDRYAFDINATNEVTALDDSSNTVNSSNADPNGATVPTVDITVKNAGTLAVAATPNTAAKKALYWGQSGEEVASFRFTSTNEAVLLETVNIQYKNGTDTAADWTTNVKSVTLAYKNQAGNTLTKTSTVASTGSATFGWTGNDDSTKPYIPKDSSADVTVKLNMTTRAEGATSTAAGDAVSPTFSVELNMGDAASFQAKGSGSGYKITGADNGDGSTNLTDVNGNAMYVYRVFPRFTKITDSSYSANSNTLISAADQEVLRFTIEAIGLPDSNLFFDNVGAASGTLKFEVIASGEQGDVDPAFKFYKVVGGTETLVDNATIDDPGALAPNASITIDFSSMDIEIPGGSSMNFLLKVDLTNFNDNGDFFTVYMRDDENGLVKFVDNYVSAASADVSSILGVFKNLELVSTTKLRAI
ncbi:MAG: hypothetical protein ABH833_00660 [Parcubacteria group bacterium]